MRNPARSLNLTEDRLERRSGARILDIPTTNFFDFVLILVIAGALAIVLTLPLYITFQSLRSRH